MVDPFPEYLEYLEYLKRNHLLLGPILIKSEELLELLESGVLVAVHLYHSLEQLQLDLNVALALDLIVELGPLE